MLNVSTKTGDKGQSGLANGQRLGKNELIFEVLGTQDELNSWIGLCVATMSGHFQAEKDFLVNVQDVLFQIGAEIARSPKIKVEQRFLEELEKRSETLQKTMGKDWTTKFLYPGGNELAAKVDVTRTVCRRLERLIVRYNTQEEISSLILQYINRLSDYLYVLRCYINHEEQYQEKKFEYGRALEKNLKK